MPSPSSTISTPSLTNTASLPEDPSAFATTTKTTSSQSSPSPRLSSIPRPLPYAISRTPSQQLPIYQLSKSGGNKHLTRIRKIEGDLSQLKTDIRAALGVEDYVIDRMGRKKENVAINWTTRQIVVRGWRKPELVKWAEGMGF
jgi:large subunit ribosomal protein L49